MAVIAENRVIMEQSRGTYALVSTATYFAVTSVSLKNSSNSWHEYSVKLYQVVKQSRASYVSVSTAALSYFANKLY